MHVTVVRDYPITALVSIGRDSPDECRLHTCLSRKLYFRFAVDGTHPPADQDEPSSDEDGDDDDYLIEARRLGHQSNSRRLRVSSSIAVQPPTSPLRVSPEIEDSTNGTGLVTTTSTLHRLNSISGLPPAIWKEPFNPPAGIYEHYPNLFTSLAASVCEIATDGHPAPDLILRATSVSALANQFHKLLGEAADKDDFTEILAPERHFFV